MERRQVGTSGLRVSALGLGTMTWGRDTDEVDAGDVLRTFLDAGGDLVDTAASYADGDAERILGGLLAGTVEREDVVIVTKAGVRQGAQGARRDAARRRRRRARRPRAGVLAAAARPGT
jgi:aryl-alcohol dehydrogenase-like predicted oxidoreductase